ncbi:flavodoxin [Desulfitobacterium chlororespirans]|uniref:Flavodoxin n=1 Tax=Desulfitobacterium chlororespirans DSM 11544 TaxID=1121395 RepID=A0A1M7SCT6_9FIRM|nr:flavodoxin [Desulfitobacterium chlororespirans]SHN56305.1 Flavodoxin [Desulfitobacterium chlororespirans DSM 11544]
MKKTLSMLLSVMIIVGLTACGNIADNGTGGMPKETDSQTTNEPEDATGDVPKVLVTYYSASGNTERVANSVAEASGADIFVITPVDEYTDADLVWRDENSRVNQEHEDENRRVELISTAVKDFDSYEVIFIGYPIWWGDAAWVVDDFVKNNDFTGKTVIPFCTSSSLPLGESGTKLAAMAGTGEWLEGKRFPSGADESEVKEWVGSLDFFQ